MVWLLDGEKCLIHLAILTRYRHVTDGQRDILQQLSLQHGHSDGRGYIGIYVTVNLCNQ